LHKFLYRFSIDFFLSIDSKGRKGGKQQEQNWYGEQQQQQQQQKDFYGNLDVNDEDDGVEHDDQQEINEYYQK